MDGSADNTPAAQAAYACEANMEAGLLSQYPGGRDRIPRASRLDEQPKTLSHPINSVNYEDS